MGKSLFITATLVLVASIVSSAVADNNNFGHPAEPRWRAIVRKDIDQAIIDALEKLRSEMKTGDATLGIPPLEPFKDERLDFDIKEDIAVVKGFLTKLVVTHLSEFKIITIKNDLKNLKAYFKLSFPTIHFVGHYNISGTVLSSLNVYGDGDFWLTLTNLTTWGNVAISSKDGTEDSSFVINTLAIDFTLSDMKANFENIEGGGSQGDAINAIINENGVQLVTQEKKSIADFIQKTVINFADNSFSKFTLRQVLKYLGVDN